MKIITRKSVIFTALAVAILATALVISCNAPLDGITDKDEPSLPGTGKVLLTVNSRDASRTILPITRPANLRYVLKLTGDNVPDHYAVVNVGSNQSVLNIPEGDYSKAQVFVYLNAFDVLSSSVEALAIGASPEADGIIPGDGYSVTDGDTTPLGSYSTAFFSPGTASTKGTGDFSYVITNATSRLASMSFYIQGITPTTNPASPTHNLTVSSSIEGKVSSLTSGSYNVIFTLTDTETPANTAYFYEILHVYKGMESVLPLLINDNIFPDKILPPGNYGDGTLTVVVPAVPNSPAFTYTVTSTDSTTVVDDTNPNYWIVKIKKTEVAANITFKVTAPTPVNNTTIVNWNLLGQTTVTPITQTTNVTFTNTQSTATFVITIDAAADVAPLSKTDRNYTTMVLTHNSSPLSFSTPAIYIQFVD